MSQGKNPQLQEKAKEILQRGRQDPEFKRKLMQDPEGTLRSAGLPDEAIQGYIQETKLGGSGEVTGYMRCEITMVCWPAPSFDSEYC